MLVIFVLPKFEEFMHKNFFYYSFKLSICTKRRNELFFQLIYKIKFTQSHFQLQRANSPVGCRSKLILSDARVVWAYRNLGGYIGNPIWVVGMCW